MNQAPCKETFASCFAAILLHPREVEATSPRPARAHPDRCDSAPCPQAPLLPERQAAKLSSSNTSLNSQNTPALLSLRAAVWKDARLTQGPTLGSFLGLHFLLPIPKLGTNALVLSTSDFGTHRL
ncbi:hypothetical protein scyTo_0014365 [Scyliorhinus torazame]|uniref:Uncharacterized protein n=1 Tax=Scyliorhinus torazame TaxID=75743 RepID=A0A401NLE2_SCYTO|nr:hypothetical protein [Scyliorhinus torazame]